MTLSRSFNRVTGTTYVYDLIDGHRKVVGKIDPETGEIVPTGGRGRPPGKKNKAATKREEPYPSSVENNYQSLYESAMRTIRAKDHEIESLQKKLEIMDTFDLSALKKLMDGIEEYQMSSSQEKAL